MASIAANTTNIELNSFEDIAARRSGMKTVVDEYTIMISRVTQQTGRLKGVYQKKVNADKSAEETKAREVTAATQARNAMSGAQQAVARRAAATEAASAKDSVLDVDWNASKVPYIQHRPSLTEVSKKLGWLEKPFLVDMQIDMTKEMNDDRDDFLR